MKFAYSENEKFVSDCKPLLTILQIQSETTYRRLAIRVLIGDQEDWLSIQQLDNWLNDYGYEELTK